MSSTCAGCMKRMVDYKDEEKGAVSTSFEADAKTSWRLYTCKCGYQKLECPPCARRFYLQLVPPTCPKCRIDLLDENITKNQEKHWRNIEIKSAEERELVKKQMAEKDKIWLEKYKDNIACSKCDQLVPEKQLLTCDCNEDPVVIGGYLGDIFSKAMCGSCALPHILDHGSRIKRAQTVVITLSAENDSIEFEDRINDMFGDEWNCAVGQMSNMKEMVRKKINRESVRTTLESSDSIEEYKVNYANFEDVLKKIEIKIKEITTEVDSYRQDVEDKLGNICISHDAKKDSVPSVS